MFRMSQPIFAPQERDPIVNGYWKDKIMEIDREKIEAAIVQQAVDQIISDDDLYERVKRDIDARTDKLFATRAAEKINATIDDVITAGFDRPFQKRDAFGGAKGEETTIRAELERIVGGYWNTKVDGQGKPTDSSYNTVTRAEWLMTKICAEDFQKEVKGYAVSVTGALKDGFRRELSETINRLLSELFHVRSLDDQGKGRNDQSIIHPKAAPVG